MLLRWAAAQHRHVAAHACHGAPMPADDHAIADSPIRSAAIDDPGAMRFTLAPLASGPNEVRTVVADALVRLAALERPDGSRLAGMTGAEVRAVLDTYAAIRADVERMETYVALRLAGDTDDAVATELSPVVEAAVVAVKDAAVALEQALVALDDDAAERLLGAPEMAEVAHFVRLRRAFAPYMLDPAAERACNALEPSALEAWRRMFDLITSRVRAHVAPLETDTPLFGLLSLSQHPEREIRAAAYDALDTAMTAHADALALTYDAIVAARLASDRLRGHHSPMEAANLQREIPNATVDDLLARVEDAYPTARRWLAAKAGALGLERLEAWDVNAPIGEVAREWSFAESWDSLVDGLTALDPTLVPYASALLDEGRIDPVLRRAKRGGAFCHSGGPTGRSYILCNHAGTGRDVATLAHEVGHALRNEVARAHRHPLTYGVGIALAEVPSFVTEIFCMRRLIERLEASGDPADTAQATSLARVLLEDDFRAIFRQTVFTRYEQAAYGRRAEGIGLSAAVLGECWTAASAAYYGEAVRLDERYASGWTPIPHFPHVRFYTYSYVFARLLSLGIVRRLEDDPDAMRPRWRAFLADGSRRSPADSLAATLGVDITTPECWQLGLADISARTDAAISALASPAIR